MSRFYYYKMTVDNGGAPNVQDRLLSLAICKPEIRRCAQVGDWVVGFGANGFHAAGRRIPGNPLVFMARITGREPGGTYYTDSAYRTRGDCIYERRGLRFVRRSGALYHAEPENLPHDLGEYPEYAKSTALLSRDFRYFANGGTSRYYEQLPPLRGLVDGIGRGHRVAHPGTSTHELLRTLQQLVWGEPQDVAADHSDREPSRRSVPTASRACAPAISSPRPARKC